MSLERIFAADGPLARAIPAYRQRAQQVEMAQRIEAAINERTALIAEAGTGTGKTFAYLVPALQSGGKVVISTGTKTLQDQLFKRDLPALRAALSAGVTIALLKGRANYVCRHYLGLAQANGQFLSRAEAGHIRLIAKFAKSSASGDKAELAAVPEDSGAWRQATSTRENCLGQECAYARECFVTAARKAALDADVIVVNHHLFFADVMLKGDGMGELLPACNTVIFDEAHQLPEVAGLFFGETVTSGQLLDLARDTLLEALSEAKDYTPLRDACQGLEKATKDLRLAFHHSKDHALPREGNRLSAAQWRAHPRAGAALQHVQEALKDFAEQLATQAQRSEGLTHCQRRTVELALALQRWNAPFSTAHTESADATAAAPADNAADAYVTWAEVSAYHVSLNRTPLQVADIFRRQMTEGHPRAWVFTSATLAVGGDFSHYQNEMGLSEADTAVWGSPFDYAQCALLYCPQAMPEPNSADYLAAVAEAAWPLLTAAQGRAFVLCTSLRAMRRLHELLAEKLSTEDVELPLLLQGEGTKSDLLQRFRALGNAILVASQSFWEGVDVRGEALSLVVIDKLPFAPPDDPVLAARIDYLKRQGKSPFFDYQLPRAVISMKQGAGRLIRDENDRGVLMVCDPRLVDKPYGKRIWRALPPMRRTRDAAEAARFFTEALAAA